MADVENLKSGIAGLDRGWILVWLHTTVQKEKIRLNWQTLKYRFGKTR